ncbi:hypothetical protein CRM22_003950 [Opisthorchis felineus]|uniref:Uncharacterized protein n=1 Tax=Opisthorchis felineus TaxID=147828 RepID=A0A4S2LZC7_OPIFE|nr:hypothetical protein CRM22_003950 [Opisthorchis felineus]
MPSANVSRTTGTVIIVTAALATLIAITLIIASLIWQGLVVQKPCYTHAPPNVSCIVHLPRREGFFHTCFSEDPMDTNVDRPGLKCIGRDYGGDERFAGWKDPGYSEIIESRRLTVTQVIIGLVLATAGLALTAVLLVNWCSLSIYERPLGWLHLLTGGVLLLSAFVLQLGLLFLHLSQTREKSTHTNFLLLAFTRWTEKLQMSTAIQYSHSYWILLAALFLIHLAGVLILIAAIIQYFLLAEAGDSQEQLQSALTYKGALPRYKTDTDYDEMVQNAE